ncbi:protein phosphatase 1 regulatory subunit 35 [Ambystoma mexicanum]|uniref:protein phosphatase 1 regulatory subunit 35 n=1 Tax=Ambystoma mexicanum TaxID=8296 RepID=UPI0037E74699
MKFSRMELLTPKRYAPLNYTDEDSLPTEAIPQPLADSAARAEVLSELDISMTPEKLGCGILKRPEELKFGGRKASRRQVRFHLSESQEMGAGTLSPDLPLVMEGEEDDRGSPVTRTVIPEIKKPCTLDRPNNVEAVFMISESKALRKEGVRPSKGKALKPTRPSQQYAAPSELPQVVRHSEPCTLGTPEYNTSLALGQEMMNATEKGFDMKRAVEEQLKKSFVTRQSVDGKVAEGMNIPKDQQLFQGLVSLDVSVEQVLSTAVQKINLAKPRSDSKKENVTEAPDLMMFYNPAEVFWEKPYLAADTLPPLKHQARVKPRHTAFDMYRKLQEWDS